MIPVPILILEGHEVVVSMSVFLGLNTHGGGGGLSCVLRKDDTVQSKPQTSSKSCVILDGMVSQSA